MNIQDVQNRIGLSGIIMAVYVAITPIHQTLILENGATVTKYVALAVILTSFLSIFVNRKGIAFDNILLVDLIYIGGWVALSFFWTYSKSLTKTFVISIASYLILMLVAGSKTWTRAEKKLFKLALVGAGTYYGILLIQSVSVLRRSTFMLESTGADADQNLLSANIGLAILFAVEMVMKSRYFIVKVIGIAAFLIMTIGIFCTGSRGGLICIFVAVVFYIWSYQREQGKSNFPVFVAVLVFGTMMWLVTNSNILGNEIIAERYSSESATDASGRFEIWSKHFEVFKWSPRNTIWGFGYGAFSDAYRYCYNQYWSIATHNDIIYIIGNAGLIGFFFVIKFVKDIWQYCVENEEILGRACIILMLVAGLSVDMFGTYGWWNAMLFAYMCIGHDERIVYDEYE